MVWKKIPSYEYEVSDFGDVRNIRSGFVLKPSKTNSGYFRVSLCKDGIARQCLIHQLVLQAFIGPCPLGFECCHNDGDPSNNALDNLRWDTRKSNVDDMRRHKTMATGSKHPNAKLNDHLIAEIYQDIDTGESQTRIAKRLGIHPSTVSRIVNVKKWRHLEREVFYPK